METKRSFNYSQMRALEYSSKSQNGYMGYRLAYDSVRQGRNYEISSNYYHKMAEEVRMKGEKCQKVAEELESSNNVSEEVMYDLNEL